MPLLHHKSNILDHWLQLLKKSKHSIIRNLMIKQSIIARGMLMHFTAVNTKTNSLSYQNWIGTNFYSLLPCSGCEDHPYYWSSKKKMIQVQAMDAVGKQYLFFQTYLPNNFLTSSTCRNYSTKKVDSSDSYKNSADWWVWENHKAQAIYLRENFLSKGVLIYNLCISKHTNS